MKCSKITFTTKYNYNIIECQDRSWYSPMISFRYLFGKSIKIQRGIQDEDQ